MTRCWPGVLPVCAAALLALAGTFSTATAAGAAPWPNLAPAWLDRSLPATGPVPVAEESQRADAYNWSATRLQSSIRLRGAVPSGGDRRTVLGMVKAHFPDLKVDDRLKVTKGGPPQDRWLGAVSFALQQLAHLKRGSARLNNFALKVDGEARSAADYTEIEKALSGPLPAGVTIARQTVKPPVADPFTFVADLGANALSLSGSVPSEDARKQLRELSRQLFRRPGLEDRLELASGAPQDWDEAVVAALRALSGLDSGKVALSGLAVTIEGVAPDKGTAVAISYQLRRDLPALFSTSESISWKEATASRNVARRMHPRINEASSALPLVPLPDLLAPSK